MYKLENKSKLYTLFIILMPLLNQYRFLGMSFMDVFNIFVFVFAMFKENWRIRINIAFLPYTIYALLVMVFSMLQLPVYSPILMLKNVASFGFLAFNLFIAGRDYFDINKGYYYYGVIVKLCCAVAIVEFLVNLLISYRPVLVFPMLTLNYGGGMKGAELISLLKHSYSNYRASAFFLEPAYLSEFCLPYLFLSLFNSEEKYDTKKIIEALFITLSIVLTTSTLGILGCVIAWLIYTIKILWTSKRRKLILLIPVIIVAGYYMYSLDAVQNQLSSKIYSAQNLTMSTSLSLRLTRGWYCFNALDEIRKLIGMGYGCVSAFITEHHITTIIDREGIVNSYMNGISLMLCSLGIIGTLIYIIPFIGMILKNRNTYYLGVLWIVLMLTSQSFDTAIYVIMFAFIVNISNCDENFSIKCIDSNKEIVSSSLSEWRYNR